MGALLQLYVGLQSRKCSAYVKTAIKNTQKQYLIKKGKILDNEIAMDDEGIDEILQKQTEDLFDKMDLNVDMVLSDEINVNSFLDQINDPVLYVSLCSLKELQQKVLMLRIVYVKSFDDMAADGFMNVSGSIPTGDISLKRSRPDTRRIREVPKSRAELKEKGSDRLR